MYVGKYIYMYSYIYIHVGIPSYWTTGQVGFTPFNDNMAFLHVLYLNCHEAFCQKSPWFNRIMRVWYVEIGCNDAIQSKLF